MWILIMLQVSFNIVSHVRWRLVFDFICFDISEEEKNYIRLIWSDLKVEMKTKRFLRFFHKAETKKNMRQILEAEEKRENPPDFLKAIQNILYLSMWHAKLWCCFCFLYFFLKRAFLLFFSNLLRKIFNEKFFPLQKPPTRANICVLMYYFRGISLRERDENLWLKYDKRLILRRNLSNYQNEIIY